jgi:hypothetical protein
MYRFLCELFLAPSFSMARDGKIFVFQAGVLLTIATAAFWTLQFFAGLLMFAFYPLPLKSPQSAVLPALALLVVIHGFVYVLSRNHLRRLGFAWPYAQATALTVMFFCFGQMAFATAYACFELQGNALFAIALVPAVGLACFIRTFSEGPSEKSTSRTQSARM